LDRISNRFDSRTGSVARRFDRICGILDQLGYLKREEPGRRSAHGSSTDYELTDRGQLLRRIYSDQDLILAQILISGTLDHLGPQELASVLSSLVYEARRGGYGGVPRHYPGGADGVVAQCAERMVSIWGQINTLCEDEGLEPSRELDFGICDIMFAWAGGQDLSMILKESEMTGGDFVRNAKRLADILSQIAQAGPYLGESGAELSQSATVAADLVNRGIVAYSGVD
jgi:ATP-dependent RNA helicase HelY